MEFRHSLSKRLGQVLLQLYRKGGRARLRDLHLPFTQATNFQKLAYWGLVEKEYETKDGQRRATWRWLLTTKGEAFVRCAIRVPQAVWTYRGKPVEFAGKEVLITDLVPDYNTRVSYAEEARPHSP